MPDLCCSILCPPDVEDRLLDALLVAHPDHVFASAHAFAHGVSHGVMRADEQVDGRARTLLVQILLRSHEWPLLRAALCDGFAGTGLRYWTTPVHDAGVCA